MGTHLPLRPEEAEKGITERPAFPMATEGTVSGKRIGKEKKKDGVPLRKNSGRNSVPVSEKETGGNRRPLRRDYLYFGSMSPWALIRSSHMAMILSMLSSAAVWGSSMAA